ncbi:aminotransferase class I/II-fold pyridoxal phosphate-dependent enzyme [uncultured Duncaniella sp.]|uniref:aminotransferase class I/II-fold pyridoxal phosphate-dependent enzyme n=1 Tax=uncultured Duncaniella sp. TaxID=2768039 RepID=UPI0025A9FE59|nr:aminotransferase class I/II-fold pyridoxal phosphate-dependent enzyme [uncultured Duncaniella sp.]
MQAIILAAGMGRRLGELTKGNTKCMLEVNGEKLIDRVIRRLFALDLKRIVIVVGYERANLMDYLRTAYPALDIEFVENPIYDKTNNIYSLWLAKDYLMEDDTLLLESDLIFEDSVIDCAVHSPYQNIALVAKYQPWMDGTMICKDSNDNIVTFIPKSAFEYDDTDSYYKTVNIYKFSREFSSKRYLPFLEAYIKAMGNNEYYEQVLRVMTLIDNCDIKAVDIADRKWYEIDDVQDLRIAETIFADASLRLQKMQHSFGGYWRYSGMLDFCYLVNPYFPTQKMVYEMKANFETLLRQYPSGMGVNSMLAGKYFGVRQEYICVGNGAAELIKSLMENLEGNLGVTYPTFEEYPNRIGESERVVYYPGNDDFSYSADNLMAYFSDKDISALLVVNPDNPSGNFIGKPELVRLAEWCGNRNIRLIVDESFVDFSDEGFANTLLDNEILGRYPHLCVMKSISKSYGVPGLRLGVLASSDESLIGRMKKDVAIWNINSFGEYYMQIYGKYENDYAVSCDMFRREREIFFAELAKIPYMRVIPSQANYFLCEVTDRFTSSQLTLRLLADFNILIKDCSNKKGFVDGRQYVRIAIRDRKDNALLIEALKTLGR